MTSRFVILGLAILSASCMKETRANYLDVATTTSLQNSGLLDVLVGAYREQNGVYIRIHSAGSGRALGMLAEGLVHGVFSHAPDTEAEFLEKHPDWTYRKFAFNHFVIVGPPGDPAHVRGSTSAAEAFRRIAAANIPFVSRGDGSGTHERELRLWTLAGRAPLAERLIVSGRGMALALRHAEEKQAYTLSDDATYRQFESALSLLVLFSGNDTLLNTYAYVAPRGDENAMRFLEWLTRGVGRDEVAAFRIAGRHAFNLWPTDCRDDAPWAAPCRP